MGGAGLRALKVMVAVMGIAIVAGVAVLVTLIVRRVSPPPAHATALSLGEPPGTLIGSVALSGGQALVVLRGGGADRMVVLDVASGRVLARIGL